MNYIILIIFALSIIILNTAIKKKKILRNYNGQQHQKFFGNKNIPLTGGMYLLIASLILFYEYSIIYCLLLVIIFLIGFASDINFLSSPKFRFLLQIIFLFLFVFLFDVKIEKTRIYFLDLFLENIFFGYLFSIFCLMILINGTNFIDGVNGLVIFYYSSILLILIYLGLDEHLFIEINSLKIFLGYLLLILILNLTNQLYIGDSGAYLFGLIFGYLLIHLYQQNQNISPFFIILLLWYPCFENLFSIIRKLKINRSPILPDNKHLHQLLFFYLEKKIELKKLYVNNLTTFTIIFYNIFIFFLASKNIFNTSYQISLIILNVIIYSYIYLRLFDYFLKIKLNKNVNK
jgi:UDP-N-acetylmuramyl pentapeptide phosphotransferase/UDP-N-acetylglucosamine-1-phosphate transferase